VPASLGLALALACPLGAAPSAPLLQALRTIQGRGRPADARAGARQVHALARAGEADAEYMMGRLYLKGTGVPRSAGKAVGWLRRAARQGHRKAQRLLGKLLSRSQDPELAEEGRSWLGVANAKAMAGSGSARPDSLAAMRAGEDPDMKGPASPASMEYGPPPAEGERELFQEVLESLKRIQDAYVTGPLREQLVEQAEKGLAYPMFQLGYFHEIGSGVPQDEGKARELYLKSWKAGYPLARLALQRLAGR